MIKAGAWPVRAIYMFIAVALAISLIITAAPAHRVSADPGLSEWGMVSTPSEESWVLSPDSTIIDYALADDGEVVYAIVYSDTEGYCMLKSTDSAATWQDITDAMEELLDAGDYIDELMRVATDNFDPDFVAVALWWWDDSASTYYLHVFFSTDGGATFEDANEVEDGGIYLDIVADLAVSPESGDKREIAIGGTANSMYGVGLFRCTVTGDSPGAWEDVTDYTDYDGWDNMDPPPAPPQPGDIMSWIVTDIIFSPSWPADKTILVTTIADDFTTSYQGVYLQCGSWGTSSGWNAMSILGIDAVEVKTDNTDDIDLPLELVNYDARAIAGMTLPEDYDGRYTDNRKLWVWVNYYDPFLDEVGEIFRVKDDNVMLVNWQIEDLPWLTSISYKGTIDEGEAIAGVLGDGGYPLGGPVTDLFTACCEGVQVYRNDNIADMDICCKFWEQACKPPTGNMAVGVAYVGDDKAYAVALQGQTSYEEGAWSVTFDDGDTWNQLSLVDTYITNLSDVAVSPDCNKTMLVSINSESGGDCQCDSVWLHADELPEAAEYSGKWLRTWCGQFEGYNGSEFPERGLLRLAPEETTGDTVFLVDRMSGNVYWNDLETLACWDPITSTELDDIVDLVAQDADTIYALGYDGDVAMFDEGQWSSAVDSKVAYGWTIAVHGDHILVGGQDGDVSYSDDGGATFTALADVAVAGLATVAFDSYFDVNDTIYAALADAGGDNGIYRWVIGQSTAWENLAAEDYDYTGLVLDRPAPGNPMTSADTGGVLYASYVSGNITGVARCLTPAEDVCCSGTDWDYLTLGLTSELFGMTPQALKICGCLTVDSNSKLCAIDGSEPYDVEMGETGTVWSFEDCYAKAAPDLTSPDDGAAVTADPSECVNVAFTLEWERQCNACVYDIQVALDRDFTGVVVDEEGYLPSAPATPSYLVEKGDLSCDTYYWRVRSVEAETGQEIHSWWSEPQSFKVKTGGCFIATAAYGTPMAQQIQILREFRDEYLLTSPMGQALVGLYYKVSPPIADFITEHPNLKPVVRAGLVPAVAMSTVVVNTTVAEKMVMAGLLVLVSAIVAIWVIRRRGRGSVYTRG